MAELRKCPLCGGEAELVFDGFQGNYWRGNAQCRCKKCGATGVPQYYYGAVPEKLSNIAAGKLAELYWNRSGIRSV